MPLGWGGIWLRGKRGQSPVARLPVDVTSKDARKVRTIPLL